MADDSLGINVWQVLWPYDPDVTPPKPKLWVAVAPRHGLFMRINSHPHPLRPFAVRLPHELHPFLEHDSWLNCGQVVQCDEYRLADLLDRQNMPERKGVIGEIHPSVRPAVVDMVRRATTLSAEHKALVSIAPGWGER